MAKRGGLWAVLGIDPTNFTKGLETAKKKLNKFGYRMNAIGGQMTRGLSVPLVAAGGVAVKFAADFEDAMTKSTSIMGGLSDTMKETMASTALSVAKTSKFSARETAEAYYFLASAGLDAAESIQALPAVTKLATAGNFDLSLATDLLTDAQSALGLSIGSVSEKMGHMAHVSDVLVKANTIANATTQQFSESLTNRAGAALRMVGKDIEEGVAILAAWADQGVKGAEAGTRLDIVLRDLQKAAIAARGSNQEFFDAVYDGNGEMRNLADILEYIEALTNDMSDADKRAAISKLGLQEKSISATLSLVGLSGKIRQYESDLKSAAGTTRAVADKQMKSFSSQVKVLWGQFELAAIQLGTALLPALKDFAEIASALLDQVRGLAKWFGTLSEGTRKTMIAIAALVAGIGPLLMIIGQLSLGIGGLTSAFTILWGVMARHPIGTMVVILGTLAAALTGVAVATRDAKKAQEEYNEVASLGAKVPVELEHRYAQLTKRLGELTKRYATATKRVEEFGFALVKPKDVAADIAKVKEELASLEEQIKDYLTPAIDDANKKIGQDLPTAVESAAQSGGYFAAAFEGVGAVFDLLPDKFDMAQLSMWALGQQAEEQVEKLSAWQQTWQDYAVSIKETITNMATTFVKFLDNTISSFSSGLGNAFAQTLVYGKSFSKQMMKAFQQMAASFISNLIDIGIQLAIYAILSKTVFAGMLAVSAITQGGRAAMGASASVWETTPWFVASWLAPMVAMAAKWQTIGSAAFAEGGLVTGPVFGLVGEAGPEVIVPLDRARDFFGGGGRPIHIHVEVEGEELAAAVLRDTPAALRSALGGVY